MGVGAQRKDLIAGKGNGLIMLLHGGPGTGKTLTAGKLHISLLQSKKLTVGREVRFWARP